MADTSRLSPFDWARRRALTRARDARQAAALARLLATPPGWRDPEAIGRLAAYERRGAPMPELRVELGLAADPTRFAREAAEWLIDAGEDRVRLLMTRAAATAPPLEMPFSAHVLLGLFSDAWRGGIWPAGYPPLVAPRAVLDAFAHFEPGIHLLDPANVEGAARGLAELDPERFPPTGCGPWRDGLDGEGNLDVLARLVLHRTIALYRDAAEHGWAMEVTI